MRSDITWQGALTPTGRITECVMLAKFLIPHFKFDPPQANHSSENACTVGLIDGCGRVVNA
jgi:hypothetical protein